MKGELPMYSIDNDGYILCNGHNIVCSHCGCCLRESDVKEVIRDEEGNITDILYHEDSGCNYYCESCSEDLVECSDCGDIFHEDDMYWHDYCENGCEGYVCSSCHDEYDCCWFCGEVVHHNNGHYTNVYNSRNGRVEERFVCDYCYEESDDIRTCDDCGCLVHYDYVEYDEDNDTGLCPVCAGTVSRNGRDLNSYHYTDTPGYGMKFLGIENRTNDVLMGVELEIEKGGCNSNNAKAVREAIGKDYVVCCTDGSLYDGFEIISCPANYKNHINTLKWNNGIDKAKELHYRSHDGGHCGLHIHIDRQFFTNQLKEDIEAKFFIILRNNLHWIRQFSRRYDFRYCVINGYERNEDGTGDSLGAITYPPDKVWLNAKKQQGRHCALNFYPNDTVEIRIFRGTLNYRTFVATLQMAKMWAMLVKAYELKDITRITFAHFLNLAERNMYVEWIDYCKERGIIDNNSTNS